MRAVAKVFQVEILGILAPLSSPELPQARGQSGAGLSQSETDAEVTPTPPLNLRQTSVGGGPQFAGLRHPRCDALRPFAIEHLDR